MSIATTKSTLPMCMRLLSARCSTSSRSTLQGAWTLLSNLTFTSLKLHWERKTRLLAVKNNRATRECLFGGMTIEPIHDVHWTKKWRTVGRKVTYARLERDVWAKMQQYYNPRFTQVHLNTNCITLFSSHAQTWMVLEYCFHSDISK